MTTTMIETAAPAVTAPTTRDVLHRAADLLEEFGWCQGSYGSKAWGSFCALGALETAANDLGSFGRGDDCCCGMCAGKRLGVPSIPEWNDDPTRTKAEVVARLRQAAEAA